MIVSHGALGSDPLAVGLIAALEEEIKPLLERLRVLETEDWLRRTYYRGTLEGQDVVLATTGVGKVRAASRTQLLIDRFSIDKLVFIGIAGGINPELKPGDIIICERAMQHDFNVGGGECVERRRSYWYEADKELVNMALLAASRSGLAQSVRLGSILTGDQGINDSSKKDHLWHTFGGDCVEMEGAAVAMVCWMNQIPFLLIRAISDLADSNALVDVQKWLEVASCRLSQLVLEMLRQMTLSSAVGGEAR